MLGRGLSGRAELPAQGSESRAASLSGLASLGTAVTGWVAATLTGQVSGCGVEPTLTWELRAFDWPYGWN